jgi:hypothetical protein
MTDDEILSGFSSLHAAIERGFKLLEARVDALERTANRAPSVTRLGAERAAPEPHPVAPVRARQA